MNLAFFLGPATNVILLTPYLNEKMHEGQFASMHFSSMFVLASFMEATKLIPDILHFRETFFYFFFTLFPQINN